MKKVKIFFVFLLAVLILQSCKDQKENPEQKVVAIINLQRHPILDAVENHTISSLKNAGYEEGKNLTLIKKNANGQTNLIPTIANEIIAENPDLIITISTPITQQFIKSAKCPIVFGAVTNPAGDGIIKSLDKPEENITGTADVLPYEEQIKLIRTIHPKAKRLGIIYNPAEGPSRFALQHIEVYAPKYGFQLVKKTVAKTLEIQNAAQTIINECDVILVSSDNTVTGGLSSIVNIAIKNKKPLYAGDEGSIQKGAIGSYSINYDMIGEETGKLAARVLAGEKNIPVFVSTKGDLVINTKAAELMGVTLPDSLINIALKKYNTIQ